MAETRALCIGRKLHFRNLTLAVFMFNDDEKVQSVNWKKKIKINVFNGHIYISDFDNNLWQINKGVFLCFSRTWPDPAHCCKAID